MFFWYNRSVRETIDGPPGGAAVMASESTLEPASIRYAGRAELHRGDAIERLAAFAACDVRPELVVTSPPYNLGKDYGISNDRLTYAEYLAWSERWINAVHDLLPDGGRFCLNVPVDISQPDGKRTIVLPLACHLQQLAQEAGLAYQTTIDWCEGNIGRRTAWGSYKSPTAPFVTNPNERILVFYKGERWKRDGRGRTWDIEPQQFIDWTLGSWSFPGASARRIGHPAPFPEELPRRLILLFSFREDVVLDPFVGSGTTCRVAERLGRRSIGIDRNHAYLQAAERSIVDDRVVVDRAGRRFIPETMPLPIYKEEEEEPTAAGGVLAS
jgi:site-specific DNA-methyltransferase (adenine-specific)